MIDRWPWITEAGSRNDRTIDGGNRGETRQGRVFEDGAKRVESSRERRVGRSEQAAKSVGE